MLSVLMVAQGNTETQQEPVSEHLGSREADGKKRIPRGFPPFQSQETALESECHLLPALDICALLEVS